MREGGRGGRREGEREGGEEERKGREEEREGMEGGREGGRGERDGGEGGREGGMEGGRENRINNVLRFLFISSSSERSLVMYVQDTQEGVLVADSMSHQSNNSITKMLQHI